MERLIVLVIGLVWSLVALAADSYSFGVLSQRSPVLTAEYWNPILAYVGRRAGIELQLKVTRTAPESNAAIARGDYDFVYSNTFFQPDSGAAGYRVILRPRAEAIRGQIVTLADSPIRTLADLDGRQVGFPSSVAFVGYAVPVDHLLRQGIRVEPVFGGNQEGIMGQLKAGRVVAAGVNDLVMKAFAEREGIRYRVLWQSVPYNNLPIAAHPRVPATVIEAVRKAFAGMNDDPEGNRILAASAAVIQQKPPYGFLPSSQLDYRNYIDFYKHTVVKGSK
ncbi:MAG TPA: phosphate/phosphite/phosphonate ABC transporter substrate-binding protein [Parasulfuritortus sp.]